MDQGTIYSLWSIALCTFLKLFKFCLHELSNDSQIELNISSVFQSWLNIFRLGENMTILISGWTD